MVNFHTRLTLAGVWAARGGSHKKSTNQLCTCFAKQTLAVLTCRNGSRLAAYWIIARNLGLPGELPCKLNDDRPMFGWARKFEDEVLHCGSAAGRQIDSSQLIG